MARSFSQSFSQSAARWLLFGCAPALLLAGLLTLLAAPVQAATITVCPQGGQYATIQAAVAAANAGDVIRICAGNYAENIDLAGMGSSGGSMGDLTLQGAGEVSIAPASGNALYNSNQFNGSIVLDNIVATSADDNAIFFARPISGSLTISGGGAVNAGGSGLLAFDVAGGAAVRGAVFTSNAGPGLLIGTALAGPPCTPSGPTAQAAGIVAIRLADVDATGNGGSGVILDATYGDIRIDNSQAGGNGGDGFNVVVRDACAGSTVFIDRSAAQANGRAGSGSGFALIAPRVRIANAVAGANSTDGVEQRSGEPVEVADVWSLEVLSSTARDNGRHGFSAASSDFVTMTGVSAIGNAAAGILIPFTPLFMPSSAGVQASAALNRFAAITGSLVISNQVGIELFYEEVQAEAAQAEAAQAVAAQAVATEIADNIVCANSAAGVFAWGTTNPTYNAPYNYWGSFSGPFHAVKNPAGAGNAIVDATSGAGGDGNVIFAPWVDGMAAAITPPTGLAGAQQLVTATVLAGELQALRRAPGNPNDGPIFVASTDNGVLTSAYGSGPSVPIAPDAAGVLTATLTPAAAGQAAVTVSGPCGLQAVQAVPVASPSLAASQNPLLQAVTSGGSALFQVAVTNTGDITLTDVLVRAPAAPACAADLNDLPPGASTTFACEQAAVTASFTSPITATATPLLDLPAAPVTATAAAQVAVLNPGLAVSKSAGLEADACAPSGPLTIPADSAVYYCVTLTNTGDVTLTEHLIDDPQLGIAGARLRYSLAPGASLAITHSTLPALGPISVTAPLTNVVTVTSIGAISELDGVPIPAVAVRAQNTGAVAVTPQQPTGLDPEPEPADATQWLYLPSLRR